MNISEQPRQPGTPVISSEALVGIGITLAWLGVLCLLLGWAEHMRSVPKIGWIWLALGAVLFALGGLIAVSARSRNSRRIGADPVLPSSVPTDVARSQSEPEEQRY
jgi:hypothetical protein